MASRYGWHRDELYFIQCGRRLAWGFVDQPPFTPAVARLAEAVFGSSLLGLRVFPAIAVGLTVLLAAAIAAELGGGKRARLITAVVTATTPLVLGTGHLLSTATFDLLAWTVILYLVVRLHHRNDPRLWVPIGIAFGVAFLNKHTVVFLAGALAVGLLSTAGRRLLLSRWLLLGVAIAGALMAPNLAWHATRDWPVIAMLRSLADESGAEAHLLFVPAQLLQSGPGVLVWLPGVAWLARSRFRAVAVSYLVLVVVFTVTGGKPYYLAGAYPTLIAAGAVRIEAWSMRRVVSIAAIGAAIATALALPAVPVEWQAHHPIEDLELEAGAQLGWPEMAAVVAREVNALEPAERASVSIYAQNYGEAGAIDLFGPDRGLPRAASPHNSYWWWGPPRETAVTVVIGVPDEWLSRLAFGSCRHRHTFRAPAGVMTEEVGRKVHICRDHQRRWVDLWEELQLYAA